MFLTSKQKPHLQEMEHFHYHDASHFLSCSIMFSPSTSEATLTSSHVDITSSNNGTEPLDTSLHPPHRTECKREQRHEKPANCRAAQTTRFPPANLAGTARFTF